MQEYSSDSIRLVDEMVMTHAEWISSAGFVSSKNSYVCFRRMLDLDDVCDLNICITANNRYRLWVNGNFIGDGPTPSPSAYGYVDAYALSAVGLEHRNAVCVLVHCNGIMNVSMPALMAQVCDAEGKVLLATSEEWEAEHSNLHKFLTNK